MSDPQKRVHTLLTDGAVAGLSAQEQDELEALLDGEAIDPSYELAAAGIELGLLDHTEPLPTALEATLIEQADRYWGFAELRPREPTLGGAGGEIMLGAELEATPISRQWDRSDDLVLESSLTNGRIDPLGRVSPGESMRGEILPAASDETEAGPSADARLAEDQRRERFDSEVDAQLDALEQRPRPKSAPKRAPAVADELDDDDDDDDLDDDLDDDDELDEPAPVEPAGRKPRRKRNREPETSQAAAQLAAAGQESTFSRWATYVSAIAALVILAIALWLFVTRDGELDLDELQAQIEASEDRLEWSFTAKPDPSVGDGAGGSIAWSTELQAGLMTLHGLAVNDPDTAQYQLWITDGTRPDSPPVDGGVFDVSADEPRIPVDAKLLVGEPKLFVITVERPGGVVVSAQQRVAMVAAP